MNFNLTKVQHRILLLIMVAISYFLWNFIKLIANGFNLDTIFIELPWFFGIFGMLLRLFDRYLWQWIIFRYFNIIQFPNINWSYKWNFTSSHINPEIRNKYMWEVELEIKQTSSNIIIHWKFDKSKSISTQANFWFNDIEQKLSLYFFYKNKPNGNANETMHSHEWSCILTYDADKKSLKWEYYSWRDRNNYWDLLLEKI